VQEADEEIGIQAIVMSNVVIVGIPYGQRPSDKAASERILSLSEVRMSGDSKSKT
jgi:hypothetical protein